MSVRIGLHLGLITGLAVFLLAWNHVGTLKTVYLEVNGVTSVHQTRYVEISDILSEAGVGLGPFDTVEPPLGGAARPHETIRVTRAFPVAVADDSASTELGTATPTLRDALREAQPQTALPGHLNKKRTLSGNLAGAKPLASLGASAGAAPQEVGYALPVFIHNRGFVNEVQTHRPTVQGALATAGIELRTGDLVYPSLSTTITAGQHVYLKRATEVRLRVDGQERVLHTFFGTVNQFLKQAGVQLLGADRVEPPGEATIEEGMGITVVRIKEERVVLDTPLPYTTEYVADSTLEFGEQKSVQAGEKGLLQRQVRIMYENGTEARRAVEKEWVERPPQAAVVHYGTRIVLRTLQTPEGTVEYWRKMRVWATYYTPASSGKSTGHPAYGITRLGLEAKKGIIAVDPSLIPFYTQLYVPGYGIGVAADTGGAIKGNVIDLAFGDDEEINWTTAWVDIYFLGPGPDPSEIRPPTS